ncbi:PilN domain-containing protein [Asaia sp. BMEF1]|uniref:PilN domain-containing protein n=1 Tax=Asaia sp. BMEF1 TaxID=3155932 RepID=UPI003F679A04
MTLRLFLLWWGRQLFSLIPQRLREGRFMPARPVLFALPQETHLDLTLSFRDRTTALGRLGLSDHEDSETRSRCQSALKKTSRPARLILVLPDTQIMQRSVTLPLAAENDLRTVLGFEMDRLTPFPAETLFWGHAVTQRDPAQRTVKLSLSLARRAVVEPLLAPLSALGRTPDTLENASGTKRIALSPRRGAQRFGLSDPRRLAGASAALMVVALIGLAFWQQSLRLGRLETEIATLRPDALQASALRHQIEDHRAEAGIVQGAHKRWGDPLEILSALTDALSDRTYLTDLSLRQGQLLISGQSIEPTALIQTLSRMPLFRNPAFIAPVTHLTGQSASQFSLRIDIGAAKGSTPGNGAPRSDTPRNDTSGGDTP